MNCRNTTESIVTVVSIFDHSYSLCLWYGNSDSGCDVILTYLIELDLNFNSITRMTTHDSDIPTKFF